MQAEQQLQQLEFEIMPDLTPQQLQKMDEEHKQRMTTFYNESKPYTIDNWYQPLKNFTPKSLSFQITNIEAFLLHCIYQQQTKYLSLTRIKETRFNLCQKVNKFLAQNFKSGCFMKLSTRSPKDSGWAYKDKQSQAQHTQKIVNIIGKRQKIDKQLMNDLYRYFLVQSKQKLMITSAEKFIQIFSTSQRIQIDVNDLAYLKGDVFKSIKDGDYSQADNVLVDIWGRQWAQCEWKDQLRCFFNNYELNAICQYDQRCYFSELQGQQQQIKERVLSFFEQIKPSLKQLQMSKGVMDVILKVDHPEDPIVLIQINIFDTHSRASLFNWKQDSQILQQGPLQVRLLTEVIGISKWQLMKMMGMIEKGIDVIMNKAMELAGLQQEWKNIE